MTNTTKALADALAGLNLEHMAEAFHRVIEAHASKDSPFHNPVNADAMLALREFRWLIPALAAYRATQQAPEAWPCSKCGVMRSHFPACAQDGCPVMLEDTQQAQAIEPSSVQMPEPEGSIVPEEGSEPVDAYTLAQLQSYANAKVREALEEAAQVAGPDDSYQDEWFKAKADSVRRIRALVKE